MEIDNLFTVPMTFQSEEGTIVYFSRGTWTALPPDLLRQICSIGNCSHCAGKLTKRGCCCGKGDTDDPVVSVSNKHYDALEEVLGNLRRFAKSRRHYENRVSNKRFSAGFHTKNDLDQIRALQENCCYYCDEDLSVRGAQKDHIEAIANGGSEWPSNIAWACRACNNMKIDRTTRTFYKLLAERIGAEEVVAIRHKRKIQSKIKDRFTRANKRALDKAASTMQERLAEACPDCDWRVAWKSEGVIVECNGIGIVTDPCAHRYLTAWARMDVRDLATRIVEIDTMLSHSSLKIPVP